MSLASEHHAENTSDVLAALLQSSIRAMRKHLKAATAAQAVEAVHGLRVSSRRLEEVLSVIVGGREARSLRWARCTIRRVRDAFRRVRDLDVLLMSVATHPTANEAEGKAHADLMQMLQARRAKALARATSRLKKLDLAAAFEGLAVWRRRVSDGLDQAAMDRMKMRLQRRWRNLARTLAGQPVAADPTMDLHPVRLQLKRARYCAEILDGWQRLGWAEALAGMKGMQDRLGCWNDHLQAARMLGRLATRRRVLACRADVAAVALCLAQLRTAAAVQERQALTGDWPAFVDRVRVLTADAAALCPPGEAGADGHHCNGAGLREQEGHTVHTR